MSTQDKGVTITGREGIAFYKLVALRGGLRLETKGIRVHRGVSCLAIARREYGLKGRNAEAMIPQVEKLIEEARASLPQGAIK